METRLEPEQQIVFGPFRFDRTTQRLWQGQRENGSPIARRIPPVPTASPCASASGRRDEDPLLGSLERNPTRLNQMPGILNVLRVV